MATGGRRNSEDANHGRRSRKFNQDCTICHSCCGAAFDSAVPQQRENGNRLAGPVGAVLQLQKGAGLAGRDDILAPGEAKRASETDK